ncbi:MAG: DDE-type integrase/transposase/recombinase [Abitibacteriaceae bacterium]|nr:DDE-type integrase/transposase/recombinase [Abditibacteriaceae bacterium]
MDAFSRKAIGWHLAHQLDARLVLVALEQALQARHSPPGFIHHSDQGMQYACGGYVARLLVVGARVSMAAKVCPRQNAQAESFFRTLKLEEMYLQEYYDLAPANACLKHSIAAVYKQKRLHSALD